MSPQVRYIVYNDYNDNDDDNDMTTIIITCR